LHILVADIVDELNFFLLGTSIVINCESYDITSISWSVSHAQTNMSFRLCICTCMRVRIRMDIKILEFVIPTRFLLT